MLIFFKRFLYYFLFFWVGFLFISYLLSLFNLFDFYEDGVTNEVFRSAFMSFFFSLFYIVTDFNDLRELGINSPQWKDFNRIQDRSMPYDGDFKSLAQLFEDDLRFDIRNADPENKTLHLTHTHEKIDKRKKVYIKLQPLDNSVQIFSNSGKIAPGRRAKSLADVLYIKNRLQNRR